LGKSEGFIIGQWEGKRPPQLPGSLKWGKEGLKVWCIFRE